VTEHAVLSLGTVGKTAAEKGKGLEDATKQAVFSLEAVGKFAAEEELDKATKRAALSLLAVCKAAMENELEAAASSIGSCFFIKQRNRRNCDSQLRIEVKRIRP
jgi:hypothetical protein